MLKRKPTLKQYLDDYQSSKYCSRAVKDSTINCSQVQQKKIQGKVLAIKNILSQKLDAYTYSVLEKQLDQIVNIFKFNLNEGLRISSFSRHESPGLNHKMSGLSQKKLNKTKKVPPGTINPNKQNQQLKKQSILIVDCKEQYLKPAPQIDPQKSYSVFSSILQQKNTSQYQSSKDKFSTKQKQKIGRKGVSFEPPQLSRKDSYDYDFLQIQSIRNTHISSIFSNTYS